MQLDVQVDPKRQADSDISALGGHERRRRVKRRPLDQGRVERREVQTRETAEHAVVLVHRSSERRRAGSPHPTQRGRHPLSDIHERAG
jgi:hypothetical protein